MLVQEEAGRGLAFIKHLKLNSYSSFKASLRCYLPSEVFLDPCCSVSNLLLFGVSLSHRMYAFLKVLVAQSRPTLCDTMDYSLPGSSVHGILQAKILEWVAMLFSRGYSWPRDQTCISYITGGFFTYQTTRKVLLKALIIPNVGSGRGRKGTGIY